MLDQHPHGDLIRQADAGAREPAFGDLAAQHLEMLGDPRRQQVAVLGVGVEPVELVMRAGRLERGPGDLRRTRQRRRRARVEQPRPAPHQRDQEQLGHGVQVERQQRALAVRRLVGVGGAPGPPPVPARDGHRDLQPVVEHGARADRGRSRVHEPAARRVAVAVHPRQPDPVAVTCDVQSVGAADVGDPGAF
jgi:hypothetical protein